MKSVLPLIAALLLSSLLFDGWLLAHGMIKMEAANAFQLEYHALIRDGHVVLASPAGYYANALHAWFFHLLLVVSPRLEVVGGLLNVVHYVAIGVLFAGLRRRLGTQAAALAAGFALVAPVAPILSKHVISTALVPLAGAAYLLAHLDLAAGKPALGRCVAWLAVLVAFNQGLAWIGVALLWELRRAETWRPPLWSLAVALAALSSTLFEVAWRVQLGEARHLEPTGGVFGLTYDSVGLWVRRAVFIEHGMADMLPNLWLLLVLAGWAIWLLHRSPEAPAGLASLIALVVPFAVANTEAIIFWQTPLFALLGWAAYDRRFRVLAVVHLAVAPVPQWVLYTSHGPPSQNFFALSAVAVRYDVLDALEELGMTQGGFERLHVAHRIGEDDTPATLPGLSYMVDRVRPLAPGDGDGRCYAVTELPLPRADAETREAHGLHFTTWLGPCEPNSRLSIPPVVTWHLATGAVGEHHVGLAE